MSKLGQEESAIDNLALEDLDAEQPSIEQINQEIVDKRLLKSTQLNDLFTASYNELLLTCQALKDQNLELSKKYEKIENKYISK